IKLKGFAPKQRIPDIEDKTLDGATPDVLIIGAGVVGCSIARELSRYKLNTYLIEKENDVAMAASSRNDGDVHVGIDLKKHFQKHYYNSRGNAMFERLSEELDFVFQRTGHAILFSTKWEKLLAPIMRLKARQLGIKGARLLSPDKMKKYEPSIPSWCTGAFYMPTGGEISPYKFTVALAENAVSNGVKLFLNTIVKSMNIEGGKVCEVLTNRGVIRPRLVINAAGVFSDVIAEMADDRTFSIHPRKGTNLILDKKVKSYAAISMGKSPFAKDKDTEVSDSKKHTKGGGVAHTVDDNVLIGPNAIETPEREDFSTDKQCIDEVFNKQKKVAEKMTRADVITYYSGIRASTYEEDFVVRKGIFTKNIIHAAGIQSPGLTAAPAIGVDVAKWAVELLGGAKENLGFSPIRIGVPELKKLSSEERDRYIKDNPDYGIIICRCEEISKGEILDALSSPIVVPTVDGIKRRVRPGMGRCQGGFCSPLVIEIIADKLGIPVEQVRKSGTQSVILFGDTKEGDREL
ncbi:MAG: FAD/NAD(P)-binding oxidoreductase, partial [Clostridia bacterium]|nr:FAD/NAD(P)-binding oxidoreductase [Clostridia bacterium]